MAVVWTLDDTIFFLNKEVPNEGFTVSIVNAPGYGARGKLATMGCNITKDGVFSETIEVDSNLLVELIKQKKVDKGVLEGTYSVASVNGCKCFINDTMKEWKQAKRDMDFRKLSKTSKYKVGRNYKTFSIDELYLGEVYKVCEIETVSSYNSNGDYDPTYKIVPLDKPKKVNIMLDVYSENNYTLYNKVFRQCSSVLEYINLAKSLLCQRGSNTNQVIPSFIPNKPSRVEGELRLLDNATPADWRDLLDTIIVGCANGNYSSYILRDGYNGIMCYNSKPELIDYRDSKYCDILTKAKMIQGYDIK